LRAAHEDDAARHQRFHGWWKSGRQQDTLGFGDAVEQLPGRARQQAGVANFRQLQEHSCHLRWHIDALRLVRPDFEAGDQRLELPVR
jgi:hypothetical protein